MISLVNGDHKIFEVNVTDSDGNPVDITFYEVYFTVKKRARDDTFIFQKSTVDGTITKTDPVNGIFEIVLNSADTVNMKEGKYVYDIEMRDLAGEAYTIVYPSTFEIIKGVTEP